MATKATKDRARKLIENSLSHARLMFEHDQRAFEGAISSERVADDVRESLQSQLDKLLSEHCAWGWALDTINAAENSHRSDDDSMPNCAGCGCGYGSHKEVASGTKPCTAGAHGGKCDCVNYRGEE